MKLFDVINARTGAIIDGPFRSLDVAADMAARLVIVSKGFAVAIERGNVNDARWVANFQAAQS